MLSVMFHQIMRIPRRLERQSVRNFISRSSRKTESSEVALEKEVTLSKKQRIVKYLREVKEKKTEQSVNYLKMVKHDYSEALMEVRDGARAKPVRASIYSSVFGFCLYAGFTNPNERDFHSNFMSYCHELRQVSDAIRNPGAQRLIDYESRAYNAGLIRRLNFGIGSLMWIDDYDERMGLYASRCDYLRPSWSDMRHRVVDVGFLGKWWISEKKMVEFDVNNEEWNEDGSPVNKSKQLQQMW